MAVFLNLPTANPRKSFDFYCDSLALFKEVIFIDSQDYMYRMSCTLNDVDLFLDFYISGSQRYNDSFGGHTLTPVSFTISTFDELNLTLDLKKAGVEYSTEWNKVGIWLTVSDPFNNQLTVNAPSIG